MHLAVDLAERVDDDVFEHTLTGGELAELRAGDVTEVLGVDRSTVVIVKYDQGYADWVATSRCQPVPDSDTTVPPAAWWTLAACRGLPTEWWFPTRGDHVSAPLARSICAVCPVADPCLESARAEEELVNNVRFTFGIRGGLSAAERATATTPVGASRSFG